MYKALYRKYRPKNFDDVTGQEIIIQTLKNSIVNNKISHAYLFTGPRGTGKTSIAKILAKTVNCEHLHDYIPCNECVPCTQSDNNTMTDIIEIDAASNNGVDEIRDIRDKVNLVPSVGKYKVYIIDEVHMLSNSAFNALLKTLEEPPAHVMFILATTEPHKILPTIISRCQRFDFKRIPEEKIFNRLKYIASNENILISDDALMEIAKISDGGMRDAICLLDQVIAFNPENATLNDVHEINGSLAEEVLAKFVNDIVKNDIPSILKQIDNFYSSGKNIIKITEEIIDYLKNVLLFKVSLEYLKENKSNIEYFEETSKIISKERLIDLIYKFNDSLAKTRISSDPKLTMEISIIKECIGEMPEKQQVESKISVEKDIKYSNSIQKEIKKEELPRIIEQPKQEEKVEIKVVLEENNPKEEQNIENISLFDGKIDNIKKIRVNNTLSKFNKSLLMNIKKEISKVQDYLIDEKYGKAAQLILDGEIKAASPENLIFVYNTSNMSLQFNNYICDIEYFLGNIFDQNWKIVSVDLDEWEIIKKDFNSKNKTYNYIEEPSDLLDFLKNEENEINELDKIFGDIVKYE